MLLCGGRVMNPKTGTNELLDLRIEDGIIIERGQLQPLEDEWVIDVTGAVVAPGLVDVHVHLREPGQTHKETMSTGCKAAVRGGFTSIIAMANTKPIVDNGDVLQEVLDICEAQPIHVYTVAALTKGFGAEALVDMEALAQMGCVGFSDDGLPMNNTALLKEAMSRAKALDMPISLHEEDPVLVGIPGFNDGEVSREYGFRGAEAVAEEVMIARDVMLALNTDCAVDIQHISAKNGVKLVRFAKELGADVHAEATPHHFTLTEEAVYEHGSLAKMNPPLRTEEDRMEIIRGLMDGTIDIIATDHAPHTLEEKSGEMTKAPSGIIGLETALGLGIRELVEKGFLSLMDLLEKMTVNPANLYNLPAGDLSLGSPADVVVFYPMTRGVYENPKSKSANSPFIGEVLPGVVRYTICDGILVYENKEEIDWQ